MKKIVFCNIPMRESVNNVVITSNDESLPVSDKPYRYPVNSLLSRTAKEDDEYKFVLLVKKDGNPFYEKNISDFRTEADGVCRECGCRSKIVQIETDFAEEKAVHEHLMGKIVDEIETGAHILADITYGPKDLPVVLFYAFNFAEKFLECEVDNIVYGKGEFENNMVVRSELCDMVPLYCLNSVTNIIRCDNPEKARELLKSLLYI